MSTKKAESSTETNTGPNGPRIGRKGDPRMHRALAARLENPEISLYMALKLGGFDYEADDDPNAVDSENITLGQRKNQLSRRLRLAKKEGFVAEQFREMAEEGGMSKAKYANVPKHANHSPGKKLNLAGRKRDADDMKDDDSCNHATAAVENAASSIATLQARLAMEQQKTEPPPLAAKYHPDYQHIIIPRAGGLTLPNSVLQRHPSEISGASAPLSAQQKQQLRIQEQLIGNGLIGGLSGFNMPGTQLQTSVTMPPPPPSNVAVRSLTSTAQSVGLTLEQLALTLSTSKNLMKLLSEISSGGDDEDSQRKKNDLALRLHEFETKTLSSRCMLMAGYGHDEAKEGTQTQLRFALEAWQNEGRRLQELLRENSDVTLEDAPLFMAESEQKTTRIQTPNANQCIVVTGRHIHRLEGKCGHRAILHQPPNGPAHIDFVVGDKVECYGDTKPIQINNNIKDKDSEFGGSVVDAGWPSQYRCDELTTCKDSSKCAGLTVAEAEEEQKKQSNSSKKAKIINLNDIDFDSKEWTSDVNDDVLTSLMRMGNNGNNNSNNKDSSSVVSELPDFGV